jgi:carbonic anhydrase/acetyltransferase-like protein (isoleucine patch superfamily)
VVHALETMEGGHEVSKNLYEVNGKKYAVYIGKNVSMAHQSQIHGPAVVGNDTFVGMQALVFKAVVGSNCVIEPGAKVVGVTVADGRYVPMGTILTSQKDADNLPKITEDYAFRKLNAGVVHVNVQLADGYNGKLPKEMAGAEHHS